MIDSNVALLVVQKLQPTIMTHCRAAATRFYRPHTAGLSQRSKIVRQRLKRKELERQSRHKSACDSLRMLSRIAQKSVDNFVI
jgi:hypothetical protein